MKKKFLLAITALVCVLCFAVGLAACNPTSSAKTEKFISVLDGVFKSAGFTSSASGSKSGAKSAAKNVAYAASASDESTIMTNIEGLYDLVKTNDNAGLLDDYNLKYLKGDALYQGANLAALFKSMAQVLGDSVFSTVYKVGEPNTVAKLEANEYYTLYGLERGEATVPSAIQIDFKEYDSGKFSFKLAQYSKMNDVSELRFTYYDSTRVALVVTLQGDIDEDFNNYDENYAAFSQAEYSIAIFGNEDYVRDSSESAEISEAVMKFAKNHLGFDNNTYKNLASIGNSKVIGAKESSQIDSKMSQNRYTNPYLGTNGNMNIKVANEYRIPDGVTEVATASIPATKKLIVPAHVEKILDAPFKYPQFVEEIVFEDPDNGSLVQIGDDDYVDYYPNGEFWFRINTSRFFLLSFTKVKNFTLPKTVKKIEGPIYITTDMEVLDLSQYHPDYTLEEDELEDVKESDKKGYIVSLCTSLYNEGIAFYKELGSVEKLYVNGDYTLRYHGGLQMGGFDPDFFTPENFDIDSFKTQIQEYDAYNRTEDKHYEYSPTADIYTS
ncbi:MAG: hypothetical protein K2N18_00595, partial [Clostridia bacterium]|nr:hypothetical protein [Clostridia bacterium]